MAGGHIPIASTCPAFPGSSSPKGGGLPTWRRTPSPPPTNASVPSSFSLSSRTILAATLALYTLVLLGLPLLYSSFNSRGRGVGGDLEAVNDLQGVLQPQLAKALSNRRLALAAEHGGEGGVEGARQKYAHLAAAELWPAESATFGAASAALPRVEFRDYGMVALSEALNISLWPHELPLYLASPVPFPLPTDDQASDSIGSSGEQRQAGGSGFPALCPQGDIRLFIGITSRCCTAEAKAKRAAIRRTWLRSAREHPNIGVRFVLAQPSTEADLHTALELLKGEIAQHADLIIVPGQDLYRTLPSKTLQLLKYALSSECRYTHIMKTDDDTFLRPQLLLDIIQQGTYNFSVDVQYDGSGVFDGRPAPHFQSPWMSGMYIGQLDSEHEGHVFPGWKPNRNPASKWFLPEDDLPDELAPLGVRWASGWGYMLSRDLAEFISNTALMYAALPETKPQWWGRMPWEDIMVGAMLKDVARIYHHDGFRAAWQGCGPNVVLKHLDCDAPALQDGLYAQEVSGLWSKKSVVCSSGIFQLNNHTDWRAWRNSLPDNICNGFM